MKKFILLLIFLSFCSLLPSSAQTLKNGGLEAPYQAVAKSTSPLAQIEGTVANGWRDESGWGEVSIAYSQDLEQRHGGEAAQRIQVRSIGKGAAQFVQEMPFGAGRIYRASAWLRSETKTRVALGLRKSGAPYTTYGQIELELTPEWRRFEISARATESDNGLLIFKPTEAGTYWIDDATFEDVTGSVASPQAATGISTAPTSAKVQNGGLETPFQPVSKPSSPKAQIEGELGQGWRDDSGWGEVSIAYARDETQAHGGTSAQRIEVRSIGKGAVQFVQDQSLRADRVYRISAFLRAAINTQAVLQLRQRGAPYAIFGQTNASVSPEWRYFEAYARVTESTPGLILFRPEEPGTYWIDDVTFEDVTDTLAAQDTERKGNLWTGGSFETGLSDGWHLRISGFDDNVHWASHEFLDAKPRVDDTTAAEGEKSVAVTIGAWSAGLLGSPLTPVSFGRTYTASIALKSDQPTTVGLSLDGTTSNKDVQIGPNWRRYSISGAALLGTTARLRVRCIVRQSAKPVTFWLDAAMLEENPTASEKYIAPFPVELGLAVPRPGSIVFDGEAAPLEIRTASADGAALPPGARLKWSVENLAGKITAQPLAALPVKPLSIAPDAKSPRGVFKVHAQVVDATGKPLSSEVEKIFARLPRPRTLTAQQEENSYFGAHVDLQPEKFAIARATGVRWIRLHYGPTSTQWAIAEPQPGQWNWHDAKIKAARESGLRVLGMLDGAPAWATLKPQAKNGFFSSWNVPDAPGATDKWAQYVRQTVTHYKPWISHWEIWNEPYINGPTNAFFPDGTPEQYGELLQRASLAVRESDPQATIVGVCSPGSSNDWLDRVLKTAGPANFDFMSFHGYYNRLQGGPTPQVSGIAADLMEAQARYGTAKPLWNSEGGPNNNVSWYAEPTASMRFQMTALVRLDVAQMAAGIRKFFPYTMHGDPNQGEGELYMMEYDRAIKPSVAARAVLANLIDGATYGNRSEPTPGVESHTFKQTNGSTIQVVWSYDSKSHSITVPAGAAALDVLGNSLTSKTLQLGEEPVYFIKK